MASNDTNEVRVADQVRAVGLAVWAILHARGCHADARNVVDAYLALAWWVDTGATIGARRLRSDQATWEAYQFAVSEATREAVQTLEKRGLSITGHRITVLWERARHWVDTLCWRGASGEG